MENQSMQRAKEMESPFLSDTLFDQQYPAHIRNLASRHWTPLAVARKASKFLAAENGVKVLDIGSGVGKFCLAAASYRPHAFFFGVEQRSHLVYYADKVKMVLGLENVDFRQANFTQLDFRRYDHFYFYNAFYENLAGTEKIDDSIHYSSELYNYYNRYLYKQLDQMPAGTRLATFHSLEDEVPPGYHEVGSEMDSLLKFWIKV